MSSESVQATFKLTPVQARKLKAGLPFQLSNKQLHGESSGNHSAEIQMNPKDAHKVEQAMRKGKGYRFQPNKIVGGKLSIQKVLRDPNVKAIGKKLLRAGVKELERKKLINSRQGDVVEHIGNEAIDSHITAVKRDAKAEAVKTINGLGMKRPVKGSPEAKARMQHLRSLKQSKPKQDIEGGRFKMKDGKIRGNFDLDSTKKGVKLGLEINKKIFLQPNVLAGVLSGNPAIATGAVGANALNLALKSSGVRGKVKDKQVQQALDMAVTAINKSNGAGLKGNGFKPLGGGGFITL